MNIGGLIARQAVYRPDHPAVVFEEQSLTYAEFDKLVNRLANALRAAGLSKGDKIATVVPNCLELLALYWAVARTGFVVVPLSPLLTARGLANLLHDAGCDALLAHVGTADLVREACSGIEGLPEKRRFIAGGDADGFAPLDPLLEAAKADPPPAADLSGDDLFNIVYSSGTTGDPKGIMHTHYVRSMYATLCANAWRMAPESVVLHTGAIIFNGAFVTLMPAFMCGSTYVLHKVFDPEAVIAAVERHGVTHVMMVPSQIVAILDNPKFSPERLKSLEMILSLGAPLHLEHKKRLEDALPGRFHELYGLTEGFVTILDRADVGRKSESVGVPPPFFEMRIVDDAGNDLPPGEVGEIVGRGPILMPGYYNRPDLTADAIRDGWLYSGDLGYCDEDGFLYLVDRKKDMIISGGVNVYPRDIEEIAVTHPAVQEVAVFGVPSDKWGEAPVAAAVLKPGEKADGSELMDWINARVEAKYQRLKEVRVLEEFPRNAAGKILKRTLRDAYEGAR